MKVERWGVETSGFLNVNRWKSVYLFPRSSCKHFFLNLCLAVFKFAAAGFCFESQVQRNPETLSEISQKPLNFTWLCKEILWNHEFPTLPVWNLMLTQSFFLPFQILRRITTLRELLHELWPVFKFVTKLRILSMILGFCKKSKAQL